jgi:hypothetical protein
MSDQVKFALEDRQTMSDWSVWPGFAAASFWVASLRSSL